MATAQATKRKVRINGCVAAAQAAKYADVDVITAYPIRPYTATMMALAQMVANGELDAEYIVADSEHSQLSIAHGAASSGARVFTGSSGVGVQFAYELYSPISGSRMPVQMMIADRTLDPPGDFGSEHTDALVHARHGLAHGVVVRRAGSVRQPPAGLSDRRRSARAPAADGLPGRILRLAHHDGRRAARHGPGEGIPAALQASVPARSAASGVARTADHAGAGSAAPAGARARHGRRDAGHRAGARRIRPDLRPPVRPLARGIHDRRRRGRLLPSRGSRGDGALRDSPHARARRKGRHGAAEDDPALPDRLASWSRSASSRSSA